VATASRTASISAETVPKIDSTAAVIVSIRGWTGAVQRGIGGSTGVRRGGGKELDAVSYARTGKPIRCGRPRV
jgi:hypothetical protein